MFDYGQLDVETRIVVQQEDKEFDRNARSAGESYIEACRNLLRIHEALRYKRPGFVDYVKHKNGLSWGTAHKMLGIARDRMLSESDNIRIESREALYLFADPSTPEAAKQEMIDLSVSGEDITHATAKAIVAQHKPTPPTPTDPPQREYEAAIDAAIAAAPVIPETPAPRPTPPVERGEPASIPTNGTNGHAKLSVHFSSETAEHYTPGEVIEAALECMGAIDLDPCSNSKSNPNVPALDHYTAADDGLLLPWFGRVYMNPPYGREIDKWVSKLRSEYEAGNTTEAIALVPARTDTQWFRRLDCFPCCYVEGRLTFIGNDDPAPFPSAIFYLGEDTAKFYWAFRHMGTIKIELDEGWFTD